MDSLLYTFNKKQLSQQISPTKNQQQNITDFLLSYKDKRDIKLRAFRSKKLKRYEQYIEDVHLDDCSFSPPRKEEKKEFASICLDEDSDLLIKPHSSKHIQTVRRPKVSRNSKQFPSDFNSKSTEKPQSLQLIQDDEEKDRKSSLKNKLRQEIQMQTKKRLSTSKDAPKIHFPCSDKKLPQAFRLRSISHESVTPSSQKRYLNLINANDPLDKLSPDKREKIKNDKYFQFTKKNEHLLSSQPTIGMLEVHRRKVSAFCLNAQETPRFKRTIN